MIALYEHPLSPYAQKVKIALREKGTDREASDLARQRDRFRRLVQRRQLRLGRSLGRALRQCLGRLEWMVKAGGIDVVLKGLEKKNIRFTHFE